MSPEQYALLVKHLCDAISTLITERNHYKEQYEATSYLLSEERKRTDKNYLKFTIGD